MTDENIHPSPNNWLQVFAEQLKPLRARRGLTQHELIFDLTPEALKKHAHIFGGAEDNKQQRFDSTMENFLGNLRNMAQIAGVECNINAKYGPLNGAPADITLGVSGKESLTLLADAGVNFPGSSNYLSKQKA